MPPGDKSAYTDKQKRQAGHIEESYLDKGLSPDEAEGRAWATVNKQSGGGKKSGSGRAAKTSPRKRSLRTRAGTPARKTGRRTTTPQR